MARHTECLQQAIRHHQANEWGPAECLYREILNSKDGPTTADHANAWNLLGLLCHQQQRPSEALEYLQQAVALSPKSAQFHTNLGIALRAVGRTRDAIQSYQSAIGLGADDVGLWFNLANAFKEHGDHQPAVDAYQKAIARNPKFSPAHNNLGLTFQLQSEWELACQSHRRAVECQPHFPEAHFNLANALQQLLMTDDAIANYRVAIDQQPNYSEAHINLGYAYEELAQFDKALASFERAIEVDPQSADAHFNRALLLLRNESLATGWDEYEWRWQRKKRPSSAIFPEWNGQCTLQGKSLYVYAEQGLGDEIMFASCLPDVTNRVDNIVLECDSRLLPIMQRSFPQVAVIDKANSNLTKVQKSDIEQIAIASLPRHFRRDFGSFPQHNGYLKADRARKEYWSNQLSQLGPSLKVGISWQGGADELTRKKRTVPFGSWEPLFAIPGVDMIDLQYGPTHIEQSFAQTNWNRPLHSWDQINPLADLEEMAALIASLDLIISVDNSTVHLAGALGTPTWVLSPFAADWRWFVNKTKSPWYPAIQLFSQSTPYAWSDVITNVTAALQRKVRDFNDQQTEQAPQNTSSSHWSIHVPHFAGPSISSPYGMNVNGQKTNPSRGGQ